MGVLWSVRFPDPILFLIMGMRSLEGFVIPVLVADRVASSLNISNYSHLERNPCVGNNTENEDLVRATSAHWTMAYWLASSLPGAVTAILIGGWSDRVGRRLPILLSVGGYMVSALCTLSVAYWKLPLPVLIAGVLVEGLFGGYPTILLAVYAYTSDISRPVRRTSRLMLLTALEFLGSGSMQIVAGFMLKSHGVFATECIVLAGHSVNFLYTGLFLASSKDKRDLPPSSPSASAPSVQEDTLVANSTVHEKTPTEDKSSYFYSIKKTYRLILRPWRNRFQFVLILVSFEILVFNFIGPNGVVSLYIMGHPLCWSSSTMGYFTASRFAAMILSSLIFAPVIQILKIPDRYIVQISILGMVAFYGTIGISDKTYKMFIGEACLEVEK